MSYSVEVAIMRRSKDRDSFSMMTSITEDGRDHAAIRFVDMDGVKKLYHAIGEGVCISDLATYMADHQDIHIYEVHLQVSQEFFCKWAHERAKQKIKYSMRQIVFNQAARFFGLKWLIVKNGDKAAICCEEAARVVDRFAIFTQEIDNLDGIGLKQFDELMDSASAEEVRRIL